MAAGAKLSVSVHGLRELKKGFKDLSDQDAPWLREAWTDVGEKLVDETNKRAGPLSGDAEFRGVSGKGLALRARMRVKHPGAASREFGRSWYYRGFTGRAMKATGVRFKSSPGQRAEPMIGIIHGGHAIGATKGFAAKRLEKAYKTVWNAIKAGRR